jgi:hypothetical protein
MTMAEKRAQEDGQQVRLHKQGLFWTAYEKSALLLCSQRPLKVQRRWYKSVGREVLSVGFPNSSLAHFEQARGPAAQLSERHGCRQPGTARRGVDLPARRRQYAHSVAISAPNKPVTAAPPLSELYCLLVCSSYQGQQVYSAKNGAERFVF